MNHYTYLITYKNGMKYMGVRSCKCSPEEDVKYFGSSKHTPDKSQIVSKEILAEFPTREAALEAEISYHAENDVAVNPQYYNKAKQTTKSFSTFGVKFVRRPEHTEKIRQALLGRKRSPEECLAISKGKKGKSHKPHSADTKAKIGRAHRGKTVAKSTIDKMVAKRKSDGSYAHTESTKKRISETLKRNPPFKSSVLFREQNKNQQLFVSIAECARQTGISVNSLKGRLRRMPGVFINGWSIEYKSK